VDLAELHRQRVAELTAAERVDVDTGPPQSLEPPPTTPIAPRAPSI
jgi:hypothetical protein